MPFNIAQITGIVVTSIFVLGTDMDVLYAMPVGVFMGAVAMFFAAAMAERQGRRYAASAGMVLRNSSSSRKLG